MEKIFTQKLCRKCLPLFLRNFSSLRPTRYNSASSWNLTAKPWDTSLLQSSVQKDLNIVRRGNSNASEKEERNRKIRKGAWVVTVVITAFFGISVWYQEKKMKDTQRRMMQTMAASGVSEVGVNDWTLVDHNGIERKKEDYLGKWILIYFGFTHCPDICPEMLEKVLKVVDIIDKRKDLPNLVPLFVTVDRERDTKEVLKTYCEEFSPTLLGLTGTKEQLQAMLRDYRVMVQFLPEDDTGDYLIDHSITCYLIKPDGTYADNYQRRKPLDEMVKNIDLRMKRYKETGR